MTEYRDVAKRTCIPKIWLYRITKAIVMPNFCHTNERFCDASISRHILVICDPESVNQLVCLSVLIRLSPKPTTLAKHF